MKNVVKRISLCLVLVMMMGILASCGLSKEDAVGTWTGTYTYNGNTFTVAIILNEDGTYAKATMKNGSLSSTETGDYEIKGNKVILYDDSAVVHHGVSTEYKYKNDQLVNNDHYYSKIG